MDAYNIIVPNSLTRINTRVVYVSIPEMSWRSGYLDGNFFDADNALNVKFEVQELMYGVYPRANIGICNLSHADIAQLSNYFGLASKSANRKTIQLFAGYDGEPKLLYTGSTYKTTLTEPPDMWLNMELFTRVDDHKTIIDKTYWNFKFQAICEDLAAKAGLTINYQSPLAASKVIAEFVAQGAISKVFEDLKKLAAEFEVAINISQNTMIVYDKSMRGKRRKHSITPKSGIIGVPKFNILGADVTILLNTEIHPGDGVDLVTVFGEDIPNTNGIYYVQEVTHHGELRGNEFYTTLRLMRMQK